MDLTAPLYPNGAFGFDASLVVALAIGIAFGFCLERAGLGKGRKLAAQFYLTDLTVFKVMFSAIVTAMVGLLVFSWTGWLHLEQLEVPPTYLMPQIVGGLVFGLGFVMGGYCPGTSCVAAVSGRVDAVVLWVGMSVGIWIFAELFPVVEPFYEATPMGHVTLPQWAGVPYPAVVAGIVAIAGAGFVAATWVERRTRA